MIAIGFVLIVGGYGVSSWGYCLVRGWNIPFRQWFSPLNPYQWPKSGDPPVIPAGQLFPGGSAAAAPAAPAPPVSNKEARSILHKIGF